MWRTQFGLPVLMLLLLSVSSRVNGQSTSEPHACEAAEGETTKGVPATAGPPCACPLWVLYQSGPNTWVYHAEYFEVSCTQEPEVITMHGLFPLATGCDHANCIGDRKEKAGPSRFPGLTDYFPREGTHELPDGPAPGGGSMHSRRLMTSSFVSFQPDPRLSSVRYAKLFSYELNLENRYSDKNLKNRAVHLALEVRGPLPDGTDAPFVPTEKMEPGEPTVKCYMFRATYRGTSPPTQINLLAKRD